MPVATKKPVTIALETKTFKFEVKSIDEDLGIIKGYLSVFNNVDSQKDRVKPGAFKKTITEALQRKTNKGKKYLFPMLFMHDPEKPIGGFIDATEDNYGLMVTAQLDISTNDQGIPLNPLATMVFSGFKMGYIDELSVGYKALQRSYEGPVRDLLEMQVFEGSAVTLLFAANPEAQVTDVKAINIMLETKAGDFPLADKATPWSKSKAIKDIEKATGGDWGTKANKYFFWNAASPSVEADHKFPFVANVGGSMKAVPRAIFNGAARLAGAKGVDVEAAQSAMEPYYSKLGMTPPWKNGGKFNMPDLEFKDFNDRYREECIRDWKTTDFQNLVCALQSAVMDIFAIGDEPQLDVLDTILNGVDNGSDDPGNKIGFIDALKNYVQKGIDLDVSNYLNENSYFGNVSSYGYMTAARELEIKAGRMVSKDSADRLSGHADTLELAHKTIATVVDDMRRYITGGQDPYSDSGNDPDGNVAKGTEKDGPGGNKRFEPRNALKANGNQPLFSTEEEEAMFAQWLTSQITTKSAA